VEEEKKKKLRSIFVTGTFCRYPSIDFIHITPSKLVNAITPANNTVKVLSPYIMAFFSSEVMEFRGNCMSNEVRKRKINQR